MQRRATLGETLARTGETVQIASIVLGVVLVVLAWVVGLSYLTAQPDIRSVIEAPFSSERKSAAEAENR